MLGVHGEMIEKMQRFRSWSEKRGLFGWIVMTVTDYNKLRGKWDELRSAK